MTNNTNTTISETVSVNKKKTLVVSLVILLVAVGITFVIFLTEPTAKRAGATKETAMLVEVVEAQRGNFQPVIIATGTVIPSQDIFLRPRVSGEIIRISSSFVPGGFVKKGQILMQLDPSDYKNNLQLRESELQQAMADLNIEMGRQDVAKRDYQLVGEVLSDENRSLVLREPQLNSVKSRVEAARASVRQAKLQLERTTIKAPFDAQIIRRNVNVGSQVAPGEDLGRLVGTDVYWVEATVSLSHVRWLSFSSKKAAMGTEVKIRSRSSWEENEFRTGYLYKLIGALEQETRLARILISVPDPLAMNTGSSEPAMIIGSFVEVHIKARDIDEVVRLNRDFVRDNQTVWIMRDSVLHIQDVQIMFQDASYAYVEEGINEGDKIVTTNLSTVVEGAKLRTSEGGTARATETTSTTR